MHSDLNSNHAKAIKQVHSQSATKTIPDEYELYHRLDLSNWKLMLVTNAAGLILLFLFGWLFIGLAATIKPDLFTIELTFLAQTLSLGAFFLTILCVVIFHEVCHAIFFWIFTRERPKIGFNLLYAYAAAPDWYILRNRFILIGIAPFLIITCGGILWLIWADFPTIPQLILGLTINAAGSVGDLLVVVWLMAQPANAFVKDEGAQITLFTQTHTETNIS